MSILVREMDVESDGNCADVAFEKFISFIKFLRLPVERFEKEVDFPLTKWEA